MANLLLSDITTTVRNFAAEPSNQGRFSDPELINDINMALIQVMVRVEWPEATWSITTDGVTKEWQLPEMYAMLRVYCAGQELVPSSIPILQGDQIRMYDQSAPNFQPQWKQAPFTGYPVSHLISYPVTAGTIPYFQGQEPSYYIRTGYLGIVPPATAGSTIAIDGYPAPPPLVNPTDQTFFPQLFKEAIAWKTLTYLNYSDTGQEASQDLSKAETKFEEQITKILIPWKKSFVRNLPEQPMPVPHRVWNTGPSRGPRAR